ncbi:MAG TPA: amino acid adenylation domain-containing protein, partial [Myxococcus sp.]|nr:amino acid adenylation domain-containing protein [Myxococcus sp.]
IHDDFFALGGHSLLATRLVSRVRDALGLELPLRELFEAPTVAALASRLQALKEGARGTGPALESRPRTGVLPLSFAQQRLWFLDRLEPGSPLYTLPGVLRLRGRLDVEVLERCFTEVLRRHESLRTTFREGSQGPEQVIAPPAPLRVPVVPMDATLGEDVLRQRLAEEARRPFDLVQGPLLRALLLRLDAEDHVLLVAMHHIVSDGWSIGVLVKEVVALYEAFHQGAPSPLPELPVQYADYAVWQRGWLQGEVLEAQLEYWRRELSGAPSLELPLDRPRSSVQSFRGARHPVQVPAALVERARALGQEEGATLFMVLLAAWQVLMHRYSGQEDFCVGSPVAGRRRSELEGLIGLFINTLVLRARVEPRGSFRALLRKAREVALGATSHQELPFEKLVEELRPGRDLGRSPLFQVMLSLENTPKERLALPGLELTLSEQELETAKFDLTLFLAEGREGLTGYLEYNADLFEAGTVARMARHLHTLLEAIVVQPEQQVAMLPLLTEPERHRLLVEWNDTRVEFPAEACIHQLFEAQARRTPDALALVFEDASLTYAELDARANQLAHYLRHRYVKPEVRVALCLERSLDLVVGMLGILKAGGAFVPLDPSSPAERLDYMLTDSGAPILLTQESLADVLPTQGRLTVRIDLESDSIERMPERAPEPQVLAEHLAYVIYTSGSTGLPKGTLLQHRGLCNTALAAGKAHSYGPGSRVLQFAAASFDASVCEVFGTLLAGATLVLTPRERLLPDEPLRSLLKQQRITAATLTPSVLALLVNEDLPELRTLISAGEALPVEVARRWSEGHSLLNAYGPTEVTVCATITPTSVEAARPMIGRPWDNVQVYVLDGALQPVPVGVPGELYVGGVGLARGYQGQPALTAERFIPHPFSTGPGARLYRTGDRVRYRADGQLEFLGRVDTQVKLRGFRIELGEVEAALRRHPSVRDAVALVREDAPGDRRLVAYLVGPGREASELRDVRRFLEQSVPDAFVPSAWVVLDALPLSPSGKVDRSALPAPESVTVEGPSQALAAPRTPTEELLAGIWAEVLRHDAVDIHADFFELGGHSLLATQVISRLRAAFGVELSVRALFSAPTVAGLAREVDEAVRTGHGLHAPPLRPVARTGPLPLSFAQQRLWFIDQLEQGSAAYNNLAALRIEGDLDLSALERCFQEVTERHEALRTTFASDEGAAVQRIAPSAAVSLETLDLTRLPEAEREAESRRLAEEESLRPFDLARGPMLRTRLLLLDERRYVLLLAMHHIVSDGWSMGVLIREVVALYEAFSQGQPSPLPPLPVQYADYAVWQREALRGDNLEKQLAWWRGELRGAPQVLELPTDKPRPEVQSFQGASLPVRLPRTLTDQVKALAQREGATPFMVLLAAYGVLLQRLSGQDDVCVGSPIAGRSRQEVEGLIGFFVNTLVLRTRMQGDPSFRELLGRVREATLGAYARQDVPFEKLVDELQVQRSLGRSPLFQVMLILQNAPMPALAVPGVTLNLMEVASRTTRFELTLNLSETEDGFAGTFDYSTELFEAETVQRLARQLEVVLEAAVSEPQQRLSLLPVLPSEERQRLLVDWNRTHADYPRSSTLPHVFSATAAQHWDSIALEFGAQRLTYGQLEQRAN